MKAASTRSVRSRTIGIVYLAYFVVAFLSLALLKDFISPAGTLAIAGHKAQFHAGIALGAFSLALYMALTALLYLLFKPTGKVVALMALLWSMAGAVVQAIALVFLLGMSLQPSAASAQLEMYREAYALGLVFFGLFDIALGYLIVKSSLVPRWLGFVLALAGLGWLTVAFPELRPIFLAVQIVGGVAELGLMFWLLIVGVPKSAQR